MQLILNPFEIEVWKKAKSRTHHIRDFFSAHFYNFIRIYETRGSKYQLYLLPLIAFYIARNLLPLQIWFHNVTKIKGGKIILWCLGAADHLYCAVFL